MSPALGSLWLNLDPVDSWKRMRRTERERSSIPKQDRETQSFPFMRLPPELRYHVLSFTDLVPASEKELKDYSIEMRLVDDRLHLRRPFAEGDADGLFLTSKLLRTAAVETLLANNRLVLLDCHCESPKPRCAVQGLQMLSPGILHQITDLEVRLQTPWLIDCMDNSQEFSAMLKDWSQLFGFIASSFLLPRLSLTIDASWEYDAIQEYGISAARLAKYRTLYEAIAMPLSLLRGLNNLKVFLACNLDYQEVFVAKVMGPDIDEARLASAEGETEG